MTTRQQIISTGATCALALCSSAFGADWDGTSTNDWNDNLSWVGDGGTGGSNAVINTTPANVAEILSNIGAIPVDILVGDGGGTNGRLIHSAGSASTGFQNWMVVGRNGGTGIYDLSTSSGGLGSGSMEVGGAGPGGRLYVGDGGTGTVNMNTTGTLTIRNDLNVGTGNNGTGTVNMTAGTMTTGGWNFIGNGNGSTGTFNQSGGLFTNTGRIYVGGRNAGGTNSGVGNYNISGGTNTNNQELSVGSGNLSAATNSTLTVSGNGTLNAGRTSIGGAAFGGGDANAGKATATISGNGTLNVNGEFWVGQSTGSSGTLNVNGGMINVSSWIAVGRDGGTGTVNMTGGTWNKTADAAAQFIVGASGLGTMSQSGGLVDVQAGITWLGEQSGSNGNLTLSSTAEFRASNMVLGVNGGATGNLVLNGGILRTSTITGGGGAANVDFNGTEIIATGNTGAFVANLDTANVQAGNMRVNSNGFALATNQVFTGVGGIAKSGTGTLTLDGASTYTGQTSVTAGTLKLGATGSIDSSSGVSLGSGGTFDVVDKGSYSVNGLSGSGNVLGTLTVSSQLSMGNSPGTVNFDSLLLGATSTNLHEVTGGGSAADLGNIGGTLTITDGAVLDLAQLGTFTLGDKFTVFAYNAGSLTGLFRDTGNALLADGGYLIDAGGIWQIDYDDTTAGLNGGTGDRFITVSAVPEPGFAALGSLGLLALLRRRRTAMNG